MLWIGKNEKRIVKEDTLTFRPRDFVLGPVLGSIAFVPFKTEYLRSDVHCVYILNIYLFLLNATSVLGGGKARRIFRQLERLVRAQHCLCL